MRKPAPGAHCALVVLVLAVLGIGLPAPGALAADDAHGDAAETCPGGEVFARVVALDQPIFYNRLGASLPNGQMFALARDVCPKDEPNCYDAPIDQLVAAAKGNGVVLRKDKRPRPLVLRVNEGQCLKIELHNLLHGFQPQPNVPIPNPDSTTTVSIHVQGMEWVDGPQDDGSRVGANVSSLVPRLGSKTYRLFAREEGTYLLYSMGDNYTSNGYASTDGGQLALGLFGAVHVEPEKSAWFRSQVTREDLALASGGKKSPYGQPIPDYRARYPQGNPRAGTPILEMLDCDNGYGGSCEIVHSDLTAIIAGRDPETGQPGRFPNSELRSTYALPDRDQPFRELTIIYHEVYLAAQAYGSVFGALNVDGNGVDNFAFNYGMAGIGAEILSNRFGVGPMGECVGCKYEEFFLSSWAVGDPAMVVDQPASQAVTLNGKCDVTGMACDPSTGCPDNSDVCLVVPERQADPQKATRAFYPDDPSNVYHSYLSDHTWFRVLHGGTDLHHIHHQHAHQWIGTPDSPDGDYLDSQTIGPGSSFTMEMVYNGSGNVNQTVGDSIFHCHFYPHFAMGMWALWRVHDVYETGTELDDDGRPGRSSNGLTARALPDGEIAAGTPIPALVPMPTLAMPPMPARITLTDGGKRIAICPDGATRASECVSNQATNGLAKKVANPGYPFYIPGLAGQRAPHPPLDVAKDRKTGEPLDGGLPRHLLLPCEEGEDCFVTPDAGSFDFWDFSKTLTRVDAFALPPDGTWAEKLAMEVHAERFDTKTQTPEGKAEPFIKNGLPPVPGAPYADPCIDYRDEGGVPPGLRLREYFAADIQVDAVLSKEGWHFPQLRMIALWDDVEDTLSGKRPPEPLFFRTNSGECVSYTLANLVPSVYELDDFQVRTPTDILGQHIHLVKFDVTSSDGAANGWNYEDGTFSPDEVVERIQAINQGGGLIASPEALAAGGNEREKLRAKALPRFGPGPGGRWMGAQATVQRFYADPLLNGRSHDPPAPGAEDRTIRTVFTHDHFSPSTHQQAGLYAGLVVEPADAKWYGNEDAGAPFGGVEGCTPIPGCVPGAQGSCLDCAMIVGRADGGPTSWQALIESGENAEASFREFMLAFQDIALVYDRFGNLPAAVGYCSDNAAGCVPGTASRPAQTSKCGDPATAVCHAYGYCSDNDAACVPATVDSPPRTSSCGDPATAVCYAYGFCSDDPTRRCKRTTWQAAADLSQCVRPEVASCNFIPGIPGQPVYGYINPPNPTAAIRAPVFTWNTAPFDAPNKSGPEVITNSGGTFSFSLNYRVEPLYPRLHASDATTTANGDDFSFVYNSFERGRLWGSGRCTDTKGTRCTTDKDCTSGGTCVIPPPAYAEPLSQDVRPGDPFTPLMRAYAGDDVQVRTLVGAHGGPHNFTIHGVEWLLEPSFVDSGWRASQVMSISEHFEEVFRLPPWTGKENRLADYLYMGGAASAEQVFGNWGLLRAYGERRDDLRPLPQNPEPGAGASTPVCPPGSEPRRYTVIAATAQQVTGGPLVYNRRQQIQDTNAMLYFDADRLYDSSSSACSGENPAVDQCPCKTPSASCKLRPGYAVEPLVLRAAAGECVEVELYNLLPASSKLGSGSPAPDIPPIVWNQALFTPAAPTQYQCGLNGTQACLPSSVSAAVGLHPQLVAHDVTTSSGFNAGLNPTQTVAQGAKKPVIYTWYAGHVDPKADPPHIPIEFGAANLLPSDVANHYQHGLFGALIIEPKGASWSFPDPGSAVTAWVEPRKGQPFREFVVITQDGLNENPSTPFLVNSDVEAFNYRTEPLGDVSAASIRVCGDPSATSFPDVSCAMTDSALCCTNAGCTATEPCGPITTPTFEACAGEQVRFRLLHPGGVNTAHTFEIAGHVWASTPYQSSGKGCDPPTTHTNLYASSEIGESLCDDGGKTESDWVGSNPGHGPSNHYDVVLDSAGGTYARPGDYFYRSFPAMHFRLGLWGIFRVHDPKKANGLCGYTSSTADLRSTPAPTPAAPGLAPSESRLELRVDPLVELYYSVRAQAATGEPAPGFEPAFEAALALQEKLGGWGGWGPLDSLVLAGVDPYGLRDGFAELPEPYRSRRGEELSIRDDALRFAEALAEVFPVFEQEYWPERAAALEARREHLEEAFLPRHREALAYMLHSLGISDPGIVAPMYLVTRANPPGAMTYYLRGGAPASVVAVEVLDTEGILFETVLHETSHVLDMAADDRSAFATLRELLEERGLTPRDRAYHDVPHTLMFVQAEETMRRLYDPEHVAYGDVTDLYRRSGEVAAVEREIWRLYLDGEMSRDEALERIVDALGL